MKNWQTGSIIEAEDLNRYEAAIQPATEQNDGILSKVDKVKIDGISEGAQKNPDTATLTKNGLMSATDKVKLDGIATGAQVNAVKANQYEAEAGVDDTKMMTPIRVKQSIIKNTPKVEDTGWLDLPLDNNFGEYFATAGNRLRYKKYNSLVSITGVLTPSKNLGISSIERLTITVLPVGARPNISIYKLMQGTDRAIWLMTISSDGVVSFSRYRAGDVYSEVVPDIWLPIQEVFMV